LTLTQRRPFVSSTRVLGRNHSGSFSVKVERGLRRAKTMNSVSQALSDTIVAVALRVALGGYVIYMSRKFYADPTGYFQKSARKVLDYPWLKPIVRGLACFCLWGGCFIIATAVALEMLELHGDALAMASALVTVAAIAAWLLLPKQRDERAESKSSIKE